MFAFGQKNAFQKKEVSILMKLAKQSRNLIIFDTHARENSKTFYATTNTCFLFASLKKKRFFFTLSRNIFNLSIIKRNTSCSLKNLLLLSDFFEPFETVFASR